MIVALILAAAIPAPPVTIEDAVRTATEHCPKPASANEITVCGKHDQDATRFRLPAMPDRGFDVRGSTESVSRERNRLLDYNGDMTRGSCSPSGASGMTGCAIKKWREMDEQAGKW